MISPYGIDANYFSSFKKLIRVSSWCNRFVSNLKGGVFTDNILSNEEIKDARRMWVKFTQEKHFAEINNAIDNNKVNSQKDNLGIKRDKDGILRCTGRFQTVEKGPKLLPKNDHITKLIIEENHDRLFHAGVSQTLSSIRNEF